MGRPLVYGAYGYSGELVAREAVRSGLDPVLAGRRAEPLTALAEELGVEYRVARLDEIQSVLAGDDLSVCLHCAGPFTETYDPVVEACIQTRTHYLDITGELSVYRGIADRDGRATDAGVMLLPGAGFAVVPSNCLAAHLRDRLPSADRLRLAFAGQDDISPGTARTAAHLVGDGVAVCEDGQIRMVPYGSLTHEIDPGPGFDGGRMGIYPWPEVFTANHAPGFDTVYVYAPEVLGLGPAGQRVMGRLQPLFRVGPVQRLASRAADQFVTGPDAEARAEGSQFFWGRADDGERSVRARLDLPEDYRFTALSMVEIASRVLDGDAPAGYQTPASAYGPELVTAIDDSRLVEE